MCQFNQQVIRYSWIMLSKCLLICLLVSPAVYAAELASKPAIGLIYQDSGGSAQSMPLLTTSVEMQVNGLLNRVKVTQTFVNDSEDWVNANYLFPLPDNAAVDYLRMVIGERIIIGEIQEKAVAQKIYKQAKQQGKKAALLEQQHNDLFSTAVANIAPHQQVEIEIDYQQPVDYRAGTFSVYFPMTITPRFAPANPPLTAAQRLQYQHCLTTAEPSETCTNEWNRWLQGKQAAQLAEQTIANVKSSDDPDIAVQIKVQLNSPLAITAISSPYHQINSENNGDNTTLVSLADHKVVADRDFVLNWQVAQGQQSESALFIEQQNEQRYATLMMVPPALEFADTVRISKEVILVIDVSGSMAGSSIEQAKAALNSAIDQLAENDTFNIIAFSDNSERFADNALPVDVRSKAMAKDFINQLNADGGTNMASALQAALVAKRTVYANKAQGLRQVVFITDASISNEQQLLTQIDQQLGETRLFMVGIGSAPNHYFMKASARLGKGTYTSIGAVNEVNQRISALFSQLAAPVLRDISLRWDDGSEVDYWPKPTPDLYLGEPLQLTFKIPSAKQTLQISGVRYHQQTSRPWSKQLAVTADHQAHGIAKLWAKSQIDSIDMSRQLTAQQKQDKITALGLEYKIVTAHTSLIAVEQTTSRPNRVDAVDQQVKTHLPAGSNLRLPQTGLASELYQQIGLWLLLLAGILWTIELYYQQARAND